MISEQCWIVVPAAGIGQRFGGERPKQYARLQGRTLLDQCLATFFSWAETKTVVVAIASDDTHFSQSEYAENPRLVRVDGGLERSNSVVNALRYIMSNGGANDWVMVHDAARPLLQIKDIDALWEARLTHQAAILARPISDTLKLVTSDGSVECTVSRQGLWGAQTPQLAKVGDLCAAIDASVEGGATITDEASALEAQGVEIGIVEGPAYNIKVTLPDDIHLANLWLERQK
jgi:2-C-methyl-D-erythritol 4-phosphate cytidylyltransferase